MNASNITSKSKDGSNRNDVIKRMNSCKSIERPTIPPTIPYREANYSRNASN